MTSFKTGKHLHPLRQTANMHISSMKNLFYSAQWSYISPSTRTCSPTFSISGFQLKDLHVLHKQVINRLGRTEVQTNTTPTPTFKSVLPLRKHFQSYHLLNYFKGKMKSSVI